MARIPLTTWSIQSPNARAWVWSITAEGIISLSDQVTVLTANAPVSQGVSIVGWTPSVSNEGIVTMTDNADSIPFQMALSDPNTRRWYAFSDVIGVVSWITRGWAGQPHGAGA
jgi:hypothetical protein